MDYQDLARKTIEIEAESLHALTNSIDIRFTKAIELLHKRSGRIVVSGIGKSAIVAKKFVATLNSTGNRAIFLHAGDAIHGDLGIIDDKDIIICISKSGETAELKVLLPILKARDIKIVAMTSNEKSYLAIQSDELLYTPVEIEADPNNLAPTSSSIVQSSMGDAVAIVLLHRNGFTTQEFAQLHPGGSLGKKLFLNVGDLCSSNLVPRVEKHTAIRDVLLNISKNRLGATIVTHENKKIAGIITDGDVRRWYQENDEKEAIAEQIMSSSPTIIDYMMLAAEALEIMKSKKISQLPVIKDGEYFGMVHLNDILREGIL